MPDKKYDEIVGEYKYGFKTEVKNIVDTGKGLSEEVIRTISSRWRDLVLKKKY